MLQFEAGGIFPIPFHVAITGSSNLYITRFCVLEGTDPIVEVEDD